MTYYDYYPIWILEIIKNYWQLTKEVNKNDMFMLIQALGGGGIFT